jgi:Holliday junction resolvase RusA-like endonuclease
MSLSAHPAPRDLFAAPAPPSAVPAAPLSIVVEVPGPPRGKGRPRFVRKTGRAFTDPKTENYEGMLRQRAADVMAGRCPMDGPLWVLLEIVFPVPASWSLKKQAAALRGDLWPTGRPDVDNTLKIFGDGLNSILWRDDAQIVRVGVVKKYGERPFTRLTAGPL